MTKTTFLIMTIFALMLTPTISSMDAFAASDTLPGGTNIEVSIDSPIDGTSIEFTGTPIDVPVEGLADIGMGTALKDTDVIYILDVSGSMGGSAQVDCDGDSSFDRRIDCAIVGINATNNAASESFSSVSKTGLGTFNATNATWDLDLGTTGNQLLVSPATDGNSNSIPDLIDVVSSLTMTGWTSYGGGLEALETILAGSSSTNKIVIFLSDGENNRLPAVSDFETTFDGQGVVFNTFAVGQGSSAVSCDTASGNDPSTPGPDDLGNLNDVAALTPGGSCANVTDMSTLADVITESIGSTLETLEIDVDNTGKTLIDNSEIIPDLPVMGPAMANYATTVSSLIAGIHNICVTATGSTAFGSGDVTECVDITIFDAPPTLTVPTIAPTEATGPSGAAVSFIVTADDIVDGPLTPTCDATSGDVFPLGHTPVECSVTDSALNTTVESFDITVEDTTPPVVTVPDDITVTTGDPNGTTVDYVATATDIVDVDVIPDCIPASGNTFPVGTTIVTCSATDDLGNTSVDSFFDITVELSYQGQKEEQIALLEDLIDGAPKKTQKDLEKAIKSIEKSLDEKFWESPTTLTEKYGHKVFDEEKSAVKDLLKIQKDDSTTDVSDIIDSLVDVDKNLAQDAIDEAGVFAGDGKVDKEIEKANDEMDKAQDELDKGKSDKAIDHYKKSWKHAQKAIKHATK